MVRIGPRFGESAGRSDRRKGNRERYPLLQTWYDSSEWRSFVFNMGDAGLFLGRTFVINVNITVHLVFVIPVQVYADVRLSMPSK